MNEFSYKPLNWPNGHERTRPILRKQARFSKHGAAISVTEARLRLSKEVDLWTRSGQNWRINPKSVVITSNLALGSKGFPVNRQREPDDPGVAVYFTLDGDSYCLPCDQWNRAADNLAAIAAHLGSMRDQERWGVGTTKQSFKGYAALPPTSQWSETLKISRSASLDEAKEAYRTLAKMAHPDVGGNRQDWDRIIAAWEEAQKYLE